MHGNKLLLLAMFLVIGLTAVVGSIALADPSDETVPAAQVEFPLPPGWTEADLQAMMVAGTPGEEHEFLSKGIGEWRGKTTMWMSPGADPVEGECTYTVAPMMDGRYIKGEIVGDMAGMGPYHGFGLTGFDNVSREFVSVWIDNQSTGIMKGTGELSSDGKKLTWNFTHNCPVTQQSAKMKEVETITGPKTRVLEMFGAEPKSGEVFQMMRIELTRE